jgi:hypothetical protein
VKSDNELLASLSRHLHGSKGRFHDSKGGATSFDAITMQAPLPGFDGAAEIGRAIELAEAKWFVDHVVRQEDKAGPKWTFSLTVRGAEALDLD